jgi:hypothetical protein
MTEAEWLACQEWQPMLVFLSGRLSDRKAKLYVCAGLRSLWELLFDEGSRMAVEVAEKDADGNASAGEISTARWCAECPTFGNNFEPAFIRESIREYGLSESEKRLLEMSVYTLDDLHQDKPPGDERTRFRLRNLAYVAYENLDGIREGQFDPYLIEHISRVDVWPKGALVREIFGNPFRPLPALPPSVPSWNDATVPKIAAVIYDERAFDRLPVLADALEDAGCVDDAILTHCRSGEEHFRGCWVVDLLTGRS